jgi:hypothetical protein
MTLSRDWSDFVPKPTRKEVARYRCWRTYLKDSSLSVREQHLRAAAFAEQGRVPPNE